MKEYMKPELEVLEFTSESITDVSMGGQDGEDLGGL